MIRRLAASAVLVFALAACGHKDAAPVATEAPPMMIDDRGFVMPLEQVVTKVNYKPWLPPGQIQKFAVIPPLGGLDTPSSRGVAMEYQNGSTLWLLSQWPKQGFQMVFLRGKDITVDACQPGRFKTDGVAWTTKGKLAMTLQPDGAASPTEVDREAKRLMTAGACK